MTVTPPEQSPEREGIRGSLAAILVLGALVLGCGLGTLFGVVVGASMTDGDDVDATVGELRDRLDAVTDELADVKALNEGLRGQLNDRRTAEAQATVGGAQETAAADGTATAVAETEVAAASEVAAAETETDADETLAANETEVAATRTSRAQPTLRITTPERTPSPPAFSVPFLGIEPAPAPDGTGVAVAAVISGTGADAAGLRPGDVILAVNDEEIESVDDLAAIIARQSVGDEITLTVDRNGRELEIEAELGPRPQGPATLADPP